MAKKSGRNQSRKIDLVEDASHGLNEVDEFAQKKEKMLLEQSHFHSRGADDDMIGDDEEEEVMAIDSSDSEDSEGGIEDEEHDDGMSGEEEELDGEEAYRKVFGKKLDLEIGEEEAGDILGNETAWGSSKAEYYGADDLDDEETAKEIEEEALRQQKKHLEDLNMTDLMDDEVEKEWVKQAEEFDTAEFRDSAEQKSTKLTFNDLKDAESEVREAYISSTFPEYLPLAAELTSLTNVLEKIKSYKENEMIKIKIVALSSYLGVLASYFSVLMHELNTNDEFFTMKDHPIMESILTLKEVWRQASELPDKFDEEAEANEFSSNSENATKLPHQTDDSEHSDEDEDEKIFENDEEQIGLSDNDNIEEDSESEEEEVDIDDFVDYVAQPRISKTKKKLTEADIDDFVEGEINEVDAQEKKSRKKTLRFYTSKIDQEANKKDNRFKGDDDIPYKERLFERQQRLIEEARKRGLHDKNGEDLDSSNFGDDDEKESKDVRDSAELDYYNLIKQQKISKRETRVQAHKTAVKAAKEGKLRELAENVGVDGKRAVNYQILKNKGLTPKRKKDNRNSRVKKRKKYEKAQKKLKSVRAVYSGGQSGVYEGEKTGIKKNLTKSVKFSS